MGNIKDISGQTYNGITAVSFNRLENRRAIWNLVCHCGTQFTCSSNKIMSGYVKSCGCARLSTSKTRIRKHGDSSSKAKEYKAWQSMIQRCTNKKYRQWHNYGGRGIIVCDRWLNSYPDFLADVGRSPSPQHSIDRKENNGNYEPGNVRWATREQQNLNRRDTIFVTWGGETLPLKTFCENNTLKYSIAKYWLSRGASIREVIFRSKKRPSESNIIAIKEAIAKGHNVCDIARYFGISVNAIWTTKFAQQ